MVDQWQLSKSFQLSTIFFLWLIVNNATLQMHLRFAESNTPSNLPLKWTGRMKKPQSSLSTPSGLLQHHGLPAVPRNSTDSPSSTFSFCPHPFGLAVRLWIVVVAGCIQCPVSKYPSFPQLNRSLNGHWPQKILRIPEMNVRNFALGKQNRRKTAENQLHFRVPSAGKFMATFGWKVSGGKW